MNTDIWIYYQVVMSGLTAATSAIGTIVLTMMGQPLSKVLIVLGLVAGAGLVRVLISPLNQRLLK